MRCSKQEMQSESHNPSWWLRYRLLSQLPAQEEMLGDLRQHDLPRPEASRGSPGCGFRGQQCGRLPGPSLTVGSG